MTAALADPWPALHTEFHAAIKARHLTRSKVAADLGVSKGSICGWLVSHGAPPSAANISKIQRWLSSAPKSVLREGAEVPVTAAADAPLYELTPAERDHIAGHLSLAGNARELRDEFGATRELLEKAASGAHLHADMIARLRGVLANGPAGPLTTGFRAGFVTPV